jgi:hypothetical protein
MRQQGGSVFPLLVITILLILSLVMLHNNKKMFSASHMRNQNYGISSDLKNHFIELIESCEYDKIAQLIDRFHFVKRVQLIRLLLYDSVIPSSDDQKLQAFFKILALSVRKDHQRALLNEFDIRRFQFKKPFLVLVADRANSLFPLILHWLSNHYEPEFIGKLGLQAYQFVVTANDINSFILLSQYHVELEKCEATDLLLDVIYQNKNKAFIPLLVKLGASLQKNIVSKKLLLYGLQKNNLKYACFNK